MTIEYDGDRFYGFQKQSQALTIQSELELVVSSLSGSICQIRYAGRTDRGVNAKAQTIVFKDSGNIPLLKLASMMNKSLNGIRVLSFDEVAVDFDPRRAARKRQYEYWCYFGEKHVFLDRFMWHRNYINIEWIDTCLQGFVGIYDFKFLSKRNPQVLSSIREIFKAHVSIRPYSFLNFYGDAMVFTFEANSFLHHMVRKMVGLVWSLAEGQLSKVEFDDIINVRKRHHFNMAPSNGLFLTKIWYDDEEVREINDEK